MFSTMQDEPLALARLREYASTVQRDATVTTWAADAARTITFAQFGEEAARLANALRLLGVREGDRVATFMWNNTEHQVAYTGVPAMGAVLPALNIRLPAEQLVYVANHAEDYDGAHDPGHPHPGPCRPTFLSARPRAMTPPTAIERTDHVNDPESARSADVHGGGNHPRRHELRGIRRAEG